MLGPSQGRNWQPIQWALHFICDTRRNTTTTLRSINNNNIIQAPYRSITYIIIIIIVGLSTWVVVLPECVITDYKWSFDNNKKPFFESSF